MSRWCAQEALADVDAALGRTTARAAERMREVRAAHAARDEAERARLAQHRELTAAVDAELGRLRRATAELERCGVKMEAGTRLYASCMHAVREHGRVSAGAPGGEGATSCAGANAARWPAERGHAGEGDCTAWMWEDTAHGAVSVGGDGEDPCSHPLPQHLAVDGHGAGSNNGVGAVGGVTAGEVATGASELGAEVDSVLAELQTAHEALLAHGREHDTAAALWRVQKDAARKATAFREKAQQQVCYVHACRPCVRPVDFLHRSWNAGWGGHVCGAVLCAVPVRWCAPWIPQARIDLTRRGLAAASCSLCQRRHLNDARLVDQR